MHYDTVMWITFKKRHGEYRIKILNLQNDLQFLPCKNYFKGKHVRNWCFILMICIDQYMYLACLPECLAPLHTLLPQNMAEAKQFPKSPSFLWIFTRDSGCIFFLWDEKHVNVWCSHFCKNTGVTSIFDIKHQIYRGGRGWGWKGPGLIFKHMRNFDVTQTIVPLWMACLFNK